MSATLSQTY